MENETLNGEAVEATEVTEVAEEVIAEALAEVGEVVE